ncbi:MAG: M42 family metallopeptidase [Anaerolineae bacterium]
MKDLIRKLVEAYGPSGDEAEVRGLIQAEIEGLVDEMHTDAMGNLIALKRGAEGGKRMMIAAHMDEIGVAVTYVDKKGFLRVGPVGGVATLTVVGNRVRFANGAVGVLGWEKWMREQKERPQWDQIYLDMGANGPESVPVTVGDVGCFMRPMDDLGDRLVSKAMDDRIGCAVAVQALKEIQAPANDLYFVFTTQEEVGTRGAMVSAFGVEPEVGIALDVTLVADTPEAHPLPMVLGAGPAIKLMDSGMITHPGVKRWMIAAAEGLGIPYQREVLDMGATDAREIQRTRAGVPAGCISIPCRYVHTPSEMVDYGDVQGCVKLLAELASKPINL